MGRVRLPGCGSGGSATLWLPALLLLLLLTVGVLVGTFALFYRVSCCCAPVCAQSRNRLPGNVFFLVISRQYFVFYTIGK